jgi:hypothetical protein
MNVQAGCWLWPNQPGLGESGVDGHPTPVVDCEGDRLLGIRYQGGLLRSVGQVTQLVHPDLRTDADYLGHLPFRPVHALQPKTSQ